MTVANKPVAATAALMMGLFLLAAWKDTFFFTLHFVESLIYLVIILLLFYLEDRFGYILGLLVPLGWIILGYIFGILHMRLFEFGFVGALRGVIVLSGILLMVLCWRALQREIVGTPYLRSTVLVGAAVTATYYGVLFLLYRRLVQP